MGMNPNKTSPLLQTDFLPVSQMNGLLWTALVDPQSAISSGGTYIEIGPGLNDGVMGVELINGEGIVHLMEIPRYWDRTKPVTARSIWVLKSTPAGAETIGGTFSTLLMTPGTTVLDITAVTAAGTEAIATAAANPAGAIMRGNGVNLSTWVPASLGTAVRYMYVQLTAVFVTTVDAYLLGFEFEYTQRFGRGTNFKGQPWVAGD